MKMSVHLIDRRRHDEIGRDTIDGRYFLSVFELEKNPLIWQAAKIKESKGRAELLWKVIFLEDECTERSG